MLLGAWVKPPENPRWILDVGAGSGLLSLMMAQRWPQAVVNAVEIDKAAHEECLQNFSNSPWQQRLQSHHLDFTRWNCQYEFDLIISNPPYFSEQVFSPDSQRMMARSEGSLNLISLIEISAGLLKPNGVIALVSKYSRLDEIKFLAEVKRFGLNVTLVSGSEGKEPALCLAMMGPTVSESLDCLDIKDRNGNYTESYVNLTKDFYVNF